MGQRTRPLNRTLDSHGTAGITHIATAAACSSSIASCWADPIHPHCCCGHQPHHGRAARSVPACSRTAVGAVKWRAVRADERRRRAWGGGGCSTSTQGNRCIGQHTCWPAFCITALMAHPVIRSPSTYLGTTLPTDPAYPTLVTHACRCAHEGQGRGGRGRRGMGKASTGLLHKMNRYVARSGRMRRQNTCSRHA